MSTYQTGDGQQWWVDLNGERYDAVEGTMIYASPQTAFEGGVVLGDSSRRTDRRTVNVVLADTTEGLGTDEYVESQGLTTYTIAECETRFGKPIARPAKESFGAIPYSVMDGPVHIEYVGRTNCILVAWFPGGHAMRWTGSAWVFLESSTKTGYTSFIRFANRYVMTRPPGGQGILVSYDGVTWTEDPARSTAGIAETHIGSVIHDNKLYTYFADHGTIAYNIPTGSQAELKETEKLNLQPNERVVQLVEWQYDNTATVYIVTNQRILWLDDLTDTLHAYLDLTAYIDPTGYSLPWLTAHSDDNAYLTLFVPNAGGPYSASVIQLSPNQYDSNAGPDSRGGIPYSDQFDVLFCVSGLNWLWAFAYGHLDPITGVLQSGGRTLARGPNGGWHTMFNEASNSVLGGGVGNGVLYTVMASGAVYGQRSHVDTRRIPAVRGNIGAYDTVPQRIVYAWTDLGIEEAITIRDVEIDARILRSPGIPTGSTVDVHYATDGNLNWTYLAGLTALNLFPQRIPLNGGAGIVCMEFRVKLTITATATTTPVIDKVVIHGLPSPDVRQVYSGQIDLRGAETDTPNGRRRATLRAKLDALAKQKSFVTLAYGYGSWRRTAQSVRVSVTGREDPALGEGVYTFTAYDYSVAPSG